MSEPVKELVANARRASTKGQMESAWRKWQGWLRQRPEVQISLSSILDFFAFLVLDEGFASTTLNTYKALLAVPLRSVGVDLNSWLVKDLIKGAFLRNPPKPKRMPRWKLEKVLQLLRTERFCERVLAYDMLRKALFLVALASANRVSELARVDRTSLRLEEGVLVMAVSPGFLYKNQRAGRCPPDIRVHPFPEDFRICPVYWATRWRDTSKKGGLLFHNSRNGNPLSSTTVSSLLCSLIEEADPGTLPQGHDLRRFSSSYAWVRGVLPADIARAVFWSSSSTFVSRYLIADLEDVPCSVVTGARPSH